MLIQARPHLGFVALIGWLACLPGSLGLQLSGATPAGKIQRLLLDIRQSTSRAAEDADLVFATLGTYSQQLEVSVENEIGGLNKTLSTLLSKQAKFAAGATSSAHEIQSLGESLVGSQHVASTYEKGSNAVEKKFDNILETVDNIASLLQNAAVAPNGILVTSEASDGGSTKVLSAMQHLLQVHAKSLAPQYSDVLGIFKGDGTTHFTPLLLSRSIAALQFVKRELRGKKIQSLGQFEARVQKYSSDVTSTSANIDEKRGMEAENSQRNEEIAASVAFTKTVLERDLTFLSLLSDAGKARNAVVTKIHNLRSKEQQTLQDLVDILSGKYNVKTGAAPAFLQTNMRALKPAAISNLQTEIEEGLHKGKSEKNLHELLMKVKASLDRSTESTMNAESVRGIMENLQDVLHDVEDEQSKADAVKRKCDNQMYRAKEQEQALKANIALINMAQSHTETAIQAVKQSIRSIAKKTEALTMSAEDSERINSHALGTLQEQARDRSTILVALSRAAEIAEQSDLADTPVVTLLKQLRDVTTEHEVQERSYREQQVALKKAVSSYLHEYSEALKERAFQYKDTVAALELHRDEIADDEAGQKDSLVSSNELEEEDKEMCQGIMDAYDAHSKRRLELIGLLKRMLPKVPEIVNMETRSSE